MKEVQTGLKLMIVAGARPNFMKVAAIIAAIDEHNSTGTVPIEYRLVHTGQHYDDQMSKAFFDDLEMPKPHVELEVGSASHAQQTAEIMKRFEPVVCQECPDIVMVVGDVNSTIACSLVASKLTYSNQWSGGRRNRPAIAHVEAGLRSFDRRMPEEINRILTDTLADYLFVTEQEAIQNLKNEGIEEKRIFFVGNTMVDCLLKHKNKAKESTILEDLNLLQSNQQTVHGAVTSNPSQNLPSQHSVRPYGVLTLHRPSNVDIQKVLEEILEAVRELSEELPILFPIHPRTKNRIHDFHLNRYFAKPTESPDQGHGIFSLEPMGYLDFLALTSHARLVLTDSGGLQEETTILGIPCLTLRDNTERPITISQGTNILSGTKKDCILSLARAQLNRQKKGTIPPLWDGRAGQRIIDILHGLEREKHRHSS